MIFAANMNVPVCFSTKVLDAHFQVFSFVGDLF